MQKTYLSISKWMKLDEEGKGSKLFAAYCEERQFEKH